MTIQSTRHLERQIVNLLLEIKDREEKNQYPQDLYQPRRDAYRAQVETETMKTPAQSGNHAGKQ